MSDLPRNSGSRPSARARIAAWLGACVTAAALGLLFLYPVGRPSGEAREGAGGPTPEPEEAWEAQAAARPRTPSGLPARLVRGAPLDAARPERPRLPRGTPTRVLAPHSFELIRRLEAGGRDDDGTPTFRTTPGGEHVVVGFRVLSDFDYEPPRPEDFPERPAVQDLPDQIPPHVRDLDAREVLLIGFMVPLDFDRDGGITSFALTQNQMFCCFGQVPAMNEWVTVSMPEGTSTRYVPSLPVGVFGKLEVGEALENGFVTSVYRLRADRVASIEELSSLLRDTRAK